MREFWFMTGDLKHIKLKCLLTDSFMRYFWNTLRKNTLSLSYWRSNFRATFHWLWRSTTTTDTNIATFFLKFYKLNQSKSWEWIAWLAKFEEHHVRAWRRVKHAFNIFEPLFRPFNPSLEASFKIPALSHNLLNF